MKKTTKLLAAGSAAFLAYKKMQALTQKRSLSSLLIEDALPFVTILPVPKNEAELEKARIKSSLPYRLPKSVQLLYNFQPLADFEDTFELLPTNSWQKKVIFYIHGGAYWIQPTIFHFDMLNQLAHELNARVILPVYPKAPAHNAQEVLDMVLARYLYLINEEGISPEDITVMGDSAGGGCSLALLHLLKTNKLPMPKQGILLSPWLDVDNKNPDMIPIQPYDHMLNIANLRYQGNLYAGSLSVDDPLVSPIYGSYDGFPPITIFAGTYDILYADSQKLAEAAETNGWPIRLFTYQKMPHVFSILPTPEGKDSLKKITALIQAADNE